MFGLSTYLDQSSTKLSLSFGLSGYLDRTQLSELA